MRNPIRQTPKNRYDMAQRNDAAVRPYAKKPRFSRQRLNAVSLKAAMITFEISHIIAILLGLSKSGAATQNRATQYAQLYSGSGYLVTRYLPSSQTSLISPSAQALSKALSISLILTGPALAMISLWKSFSTLTPIVTVFLGFLLFSILGFYIKTFAIARTFDTSNLMWYTFSAKEIDTLFYFEKAYSFVLTFKSFIINTDPVSLVRKCAFPWQVCKTLTMKRGFLFPGFIGSY